MLHLSDRIKISRYRRFLYRLGRFFSVKRARSPDEWKYSMCYAGTERNKEARVVVGGVITYKGTRADMGVTVVGCRSLPNSQRQAGEGEFDSAKTVRFSRR